MKAIVLGGGESLKEYKESEHKEAFVIAVNATFTKLPKRAKVDLVTMQDSQRDFRRIVPQFFDIDDSIECLAYNNDWQSWADKRGNCTVVPRWINTYDKSRLINDKYRLHGRLSIITAIFEAIRRGATEVVVFGHDCNSDHGSHNSMQLNTTIKELNFCNSLLKDRGGKLKLAGSSYLWKYNAPDSPILEIEKYEATEEEAPIKKRRSRKAKEE